MKNLKEKCLVKKNGITLIALVITIIILLILATITIVELRNTKLFSKTIEARNKYKQSAEEENNTLVDYANKINEITGEMTTKNNAPKVTKISSTDGSKTIEISGNKVTVTENGTTYTTTIDTTIDPSDGDFDVNTKNILSKIYGTAVEYKSDSDSNKDIDSKTWRIFYIDFANKYKDGSGIIYLKADWTANDTTLSSYSSYTPKDTTKLQNMNPRWWEQRGATTWNANEHEVAWLCDSTQWTRYKNDNTNYAIASPSAEMYVDSYNSVNHSVGNYKITCQYQTSNVPGYRYLVNGAVQNTGYYTNNNTLDATGYNSMYCKSGSYYWWLASPSASANNRVNSVYGSDVKLTDGAGSTGSYGDKSACGLCPLVSLSSNTQLTIK